MKYAFRCKQCGRLHTSDDAAEAAHPHACRVCGAGVKFNPQGAKLLDKNNWEILATATKERLIELSIPQEIVEKHKQWKKGASSGEKHVEVTAADEVITQDSGGS